MTDHARDVHDALAPRAFLHDDPEAYLAGVDDALDQALDEAPGRQPDADPAAAEPRA